MPCLIILRGPMGSGKTYVGNYLRNKLPDSAKLDLDVDANQEVQNLTEIIGKENVVAELFHGNSHTTDPQWIRIFKERNFTILSVILDASLETCMNRVRGRGDSLADDTIKRHYRNFHDNLKPIFKERAVIREITIETDNRDLEVLATEILDNIRIM